MATTNSTRGGYVLVMTLGLLALAAIASVGLARHSLRLVAAAQQADDDLQHRWGTFSIRYVLLDRAAAILAAQVPPDQADLPPWPKPARVTVSFALGDQTFAVTLADEDAKADLNTIYARDKSNTLAAIRRLTRDAATSAVQVRLVPENNSRAAFRSWGQVFDLAAMPAENNTAAVVAAASRDLTCWGTGKMNLRTAGDAALRVVASLALPTNKAAELVELRKQWGGHRVNELLDELELRRPQYLAIGRLLATESRSYSLSLTVENGHRRWAYLFVDNGNPHTFAW